jgi:hypothetical protein
VALVRAVVGFAPLVEVSVEICLLHVLLVCLIKLLNDISFRDIVYVQGLSHREFIL